MKIATASGKSNEAIGLVSPTTNSWVPCNSTQCWYYLLGNSITFHRLRAQSHNTAFHFRWQSQSPGGYLCFRPSGYKSEVPMTPSLGLINLLEQFTGLRKSVYTLDYWFITNNIKKWINSQTKRCIHRQGTCSKCATLPQISRSPMWKLFNPFLGVSLEASLHRQE